MPLIVPSLWTLLIVLVVFVWAVSEWRHVQEGMRSLGFVLGLVFLVPYAAALILAMWLAWALLR